MIIDAVKTAIQPAILNLSPAQKQLSEEAYNNVIFNKKGPREIKINHSPKALFIANRLFRPMSEIFSTMEIIENIPIYMSSFPYAKSKISKLNYIKYHLENFMNEVYILEKRLCAYFKLIERAYRKEANANHIKEVLKQTSKYVLDSLKIIRSLRGAHVHKLRYSDDDLEQLSTLELLSIYKDKVGGEEDLPFYYHPGYFDTQYKTIRKEKVKTIKDIIEKLWDILERCFEAMLSVISKDGEIIYPSRLT